MKLKANVLPVINLSTWLTLSSTVSLGVYLPPSEYMYPPELNVPLLPLTTYFTPNSESVLNSPHGYVTLFSSLSVSVTTYHIQPTFGRVAVSHVYARFVARHLCFADGLARVVFDQHGIAEHQRLVHEQQLRAAVRWPIRSVRHVGQPALELTFARDRVHVQLADVDRRIDVVIVAQRKY